MPSAKVVNIQDLIYTTNYVSDEVSIREVKVWFHTQPNVVSLAIAKSDGTYGIIVREKLHAALLGNASSNDFLAKSSATIMDPAPFVAKGETPLQEVIETLITLRGQEENFFDDILVCDDSGKFLGLVSVRDIVVDQFANLMHRLTAMEAQQSSLARQNKELFENSFRQGQSETQFRSYFEYASIPVIIFDRDGKCLASNQRFSRLSNFPSKQIDNKFRFEKIFANHFHEILPDISETESSNDEKSYCQLTLTPTDAEPFNVHAVVEISPDWGHVMISVMALDDGGSGDVSSKEIISATSAKQGGKITQAIHQSLRSKNISPLGKSVATNLVDREEELGKLMKKLEQIFSVSTEIEKHQPAEPASVEEELDPRQHLKGSIAEFSVIDLCQIVIQGTKTGQLLIFAHSEDDLTAYIYFYCGSIVHAKHREGLEGEAALPRALSIKTGKFDFIFNKASPKTTIQGDPMALLMDACRKADEGL